MQKVIDERKFDKDAVVGKGEEMLPDHLHGRIILKETFTNNGIHSGYLSCEESVLHQLLLDDAELELLGWTQYKDEMISKGIITEKDIAAEKVKEVPAAKLVTLRADIDVNLDMKQKLKDIRDKK